tara:strand:- start:753 stop:902 length:150 start_codon:yes stop_codon:yes gene_type:complete
MSRQDIKITVDAVIFFNDVGMSQKVLLIQRKNDPFKQRPMGFAGWFFGE